MFGIGIGRFAYFFSEPKVIQAVDRTTRKVLSRFGAYVRTRAKTSMVYRKHISKPGEPAHSHLGFVRKLILFGYSFYTRSVVIGPKLLPGRGDTNALPALEVGGVSECVIRNPGEPGEPTYIRARPFMLPAFEKEKPNIRLMWLDAVKP